MLLMESTKRRQYGGSFLFSSIETEDFFTPEDFTDEHLMIASTSKQFIEKEVDPYSEDIENQDFDRVVKLLHKAGELGLLAHSIPESYGGLGLDKMSKGLVGEVVGRSGGYGVAHSNHTCIATLPITYFGTQKQKEKYLPKLASGEYLGAYCLTEPGSGSDALAAKTTAVLNKEGTHYVLNGTKLFITNAVFSDTFIVYAKVDGTRFTAFIVEKDYPGLSLGPEEKKMGIKGSSTRSVILEDCLVPVENLLGEVGKGHVIALNVLNLGRFNLGSACMGGSKYGLQKAVNFVQERRQFGKRIADFGATKEKIAKMAARIYAAESLQYRTANLLENALGDLYDSSDLGLIGKRMMEYAMECAACKVFGSETLDYVADEALQLHGGAGFIQEYRIEQMYRDSRINRIFEGTNEINRLLIPTHVLRKALKGELPLEELIQKAQLELQEPVSILEGPLAVEKEAVLAIRRTFLLCVGVAFEQLGEKLPEEQEIVMKLSDIAIALFAAESALYRALKAVTKNGDEKEALKVNLAITFVQDTVLEVEGIARRIIAGLTSGVKQKAILSLIQKVYSQFQPERFIERNREIAEAIYEENGYSC
jgi:alkylation response protein AidB-like acyl-CoA dehydrogenase